MILFSHPTGNANVHHAAQALEEAGLLHEYWTTLAWNPDGAWNRLLPAKLCAELGRRTVPEILRAKTRSFPLREIGRHLVSKFGPSWLARHEHGMFSIDAVYRALDRKVSRSLEKIAGLSGVYAYEDGAEFTFSKAEELGLHRFYDLPIGYWRAAHAIFREEAEREPAWAMTLSGIQDSTEKCQRKDAELALAQTVFVASSFTKQTLDQAPTRPSRVELIPYGAPLRLGAIETPRAGAKLRVLFVGSLGQRKGLSYLLAALERLGSTVELTLVGRKAAETCAALNGAVLKHRWIPTLPHAEVLAEMGRHDVLVFPSLFEGFGLVILEAMAQGLPVITTTHTAGPDLIRNGHDGFIVPIRSADAIAERLEELALDPRRLSAMKHAARASAELYAWESYRGALGEAIRQPSGLAAQAAVTSLS